MVVYCKGEDKQQWTQPRSLSDAVFVALEKKEVHQRHAIPCKNAKPKDKGEPSKEGCN